MTAVARKGTTKLRTPWLRCASPTGNGYFLATEAIVDFEETILPGKCYVIMHTSSDPRARVLVNQTVRFMQAAYFDANGLAEIARMEANPWD